MPRDDTVQDLNDFVAASAEVRRRYEWQVYLNIAFLEGNQWVAWDGNQLWEPPVEDWREKIVDNRIQPFVRTEIAKMTKTRPQWVGVPRTQSDQDVGAARYAELALEDAWKRQNMLRKLRAALLWSRVAGAGFWKVWWDKTIGDPREVLQYTPDHPDPSLRGKSVKDEYGKPLDPKLADLPGMSNVQRAKVSQGELCVGLRTFFEVYPDPLCGEEGLEAAEAIAEESIFSRDYVERHFPDFVDQLDYDTSPSAGIAASRMPALPGVSGTGAKAKGAKIREYWSPDKHCIWSGDLMMVEEPNPYPWLPYVMFRGIPVPGRFWPDCVVNHLRPRQADLNKALSQIAENAERIGNPPLLIPSSMGEDWSFSGLPAEEVVYADTGSPTAKPEFMRMPELPAYVQNQPDVAVQSMMEISGQHEVSGAQVPAGVTAASAINLLQEQDDTRLGPDIIDMEEALTHGGRRILWLIRHLYTDQRHLRVAGEDGRWDVEAFKGDQVDGCEDIEVLSGSGMPQSKAAKQAAVTQFAALFAQNGQVLDPRAWKKMLDSMEMGALGQFFASEDRDERQVQNENRQLSLGQDVVINSYDNDAAHIAGHQDFMKTSRYAALGDKPHQLMEAHVQAHRERQQQMQDAAMTPPGAQMQLPVGPAQGALPPGPTGPSTPTSSQTGPPGSVISPRV